MLENLKFWIIICSAFVLVTGIVGSCEMHKSYRIAKAIEAGASPIAARMAFGDSVTDAAIILAIERDK